VVAALKRQFFLRNAQLFAMLAQRLAETFLGSSFRAWAAS
jgi:hypothetical protein